MTESTGQSRRPRVPRPLLIDLAIAAVVLVAASMWATSFWHTWTARGNRGVFYQPYFEPAVMIACGKGFVISNPQPKPLEDFLWERRRSFTCAELPADVNLGTRFLYQGAWRYLMYAVGIGWSILGISWSAIGPIAGLAFGTVSAIAFGLFRLGMGRPLALAATAALTISSAQLLNMPHLRDYAKAPFTLALVLLIGVLVTQPVRAWLVLALSAACGVVLGLGYGFRTDFLITLPVPILALFLLLDGGLTRHLRLKAAAAALYAVTFLAVSWPITSTVYEKGGCQWHVTLLGLQSPFDSYLRVTPAPYDFGHAYSDSYIDRMINGYRWRHEPNVPQLEFCSHDYDVHSGAYLRLLAATFPADFITRAYASVIQLTELPFNSFLPPMPDWHAPLYTARAELLRPDHRWGLLAVATAIFIAGAIRVRYAIALAFLLAYFGGYPAVQFQERHYFHLEFMGWWAMGFVAQQAWTLVQDVRHRRFDRARWTSGAIRSAACVAAMLAAFAGTLGVVRWYQERQVRALMHAYLAAPKTPVALPGEPLTGIGPTDWPQLLQVEVNQSACGDQPAITFRYDKAEIGLDFTRTIALAPGAGSTRIFQPVYQKYTGLALAEERPGCITGVSRVTALGSLPLVIGAVLPPEWESLPLYQRLTN